MLPPAAMHLEQKQSTERMTGTQQQYLHQYRDQYCHDDQHQHPRHPQKQQGCHRYRRHYRNDHYHHHHHHHHRYHHHHHRHKHQLIPQTDQPSQHNSRHSRNTDCRRTMSPLSSSMMPHDDNSPSTQRTSMFVTGKSVAIIIDSNLSNFFLETRHLRNSLNFFFMKKR